MKIKIFGKDLDIDESKLSPEALLKAKKMADGGDVPPAPPIDPDAAKAVSDSFKGAVHNYADGGKVNPKLAQVPEKDRFSNNVRKVQHFDVGGTAQGEPVSESSPSPAPEQKDSSQAPVINNHYYMAPGTSPMPTPPPQDNSQAQPSPTPLPSPAPTPTPLPAPQGPDWQGDYGVAPADQNTPTHSAPVQPNKSANSPGAAAPTALDNNLKQSNDDYQNFLKQQQEGDKNFETALATKQVDPNRYLANAGLGTKILSGLGMVLSIAAPNIGRTILANINDNINRDIEAQKNDQSNTMNLWKMHHEALGSDMAATLQTRNNFLEMAKVHTDETLGNLGDNPMAQEKARALKGSLDAEIAQNNSIIAQQKVKQNFLSGNSANVNQDPASLVPYLVPEANQPKVFDEIKNSQNVTQNGPKILAAFDEATKQHLTDYVPGTENKGQMALHQLLLPNFKSIDGTVRQAAMDETFTNTTPRFGDTADKIASKRQALVDWLHSEASAPTAKGYGIDLNKYSSTQESTFNPQQLNKIQIFMKQNPNVKSSSEAAQILKQHGYL